MAPTTLPTCSARSVTTTTAAAPGPTRWRGRASPSWSLTRSCGAAAGSPGTISSAGTTMRGRRDPRLQRSDAGPHEHVVEKYCAVLGTTFAGVVSYEDRVAAAYLAGRTDVDGGRHRLRRPVRRRRRAALLGATCDHIRAAVIVGMMSTYEGLLDHNVVSHTWMFFPPGWSRHGDWTDLAACRAPRRCWCSTTGKTACSAWKAWRPRTSVWQPTMRSVGHPEEL